MKIPVWAWGGANKTGRYSGIPIINEIKTGRGVLALRRIPLVLPGRRIDPGGGGEEKNSYKNTKKLLRDKFIGTRENA